MKKGFTLLELIVVIIIVGVLAALGFTQYTKVVEKGRTAEAKTILGQLRSSQLARWQETGGYTDVANLPVGAPAACDIDHYFSYSCAAGTGTCTANRCTGGGKTPNVTTAYNITLTVNGIFGGTTGYY